MTQNEQRIAIAEACGIATWQGDCPDKSLTKEGKRLPDYPRDLNEAIKLCDRLTGIGWSCEIHQGRDAPWLCIFSRDEMHRHAADSLAEAICGAFLRVSGAWK